MNYDKFEYFRNNKKNTYVIKINKCYLIIIIILIVNTNKIITIVCIQNILLY